AVNLDHLDDHTIATARAAGISLGDYTRRYIDAFFEDIETLGIEKAEHYPRATHFIPDMARLVGKLMERGHVYESRGSLYFKIATYPGYGRLSRLDTAAGVGRARIDSDEYEKANPPAFAVWKAAEDDKPFWQTERRPSTPAS